MYQQRAGSERLSSISSGSSGGGGRVRDRSIIGLQQASGGCATVAESRAAAAVRDPEDGLAASATTTTAQAMRSRSCSSSRGGAPAAAVVREVRQVSEEAASSGHLPANRRRSSSQRLRGQQQQQQQARSSRRSRSVTSAAAATAALPARMITQGMAAFALMMQLGLLLLGLVVVTTLPVPVSASASASAGASAAVPPAVGKVGKAVPLAVTSSSTSAAAVHDAEVNADLNDEELELEMATIAVDAKLSGKKAAASSAVWQVMDGAHEDILNTPHDATSTSSRGLQSPLTYGDTDEPTVSTAETDAPTVSSTDAPTFNPTKSPTTSKPTKKPTKSPTTSPPTSKPTDPISADNIVPTSRPTVADDIEGRADDTTSPTVKPTKSPTTTKPTKEPTVKPTKAPTEVETAKPTRRPTRPPTTAAPTRSPTVKPTAEPTVQPTVKPTAKPTVKPTKAPTKEEDRDNPTVSPTLSPTGRPTRSPTTRRPTREPTTRRPTKRPTLAADDEETMEPTREPTTGNPTARPTLKPTRRNQRTPTPETSTSTSTPTSKPTLGVVIDDTDPDPADEGEDIATFEPTFPPTLSPVSPSSPAIEPTFPPTLSPVSPSSPAIGPTRSPTDSPIEDEFLAPTASPTSPVFNAQKFEVEFEMEFDDCEVLVDSSIILWEEVTAEQIYGHLRWTDTIGIEDFSELAVTATIKRQIEGSTDEEPSEDGGVEEMDAVVSRQGGGRRRKLEDAPFGTPLQQEGNVFTGKSPLTIIFVAGVEFFSPKVHTRDSIEVLVGNAFDSDADVTKYIDSLQATNDRSFFPINSAVIKINGVPVPDSEAEEDSIEKREEGGGGGVSIWTIVGPLIGVVFLLAGVGYFIWTRHQSAKKEAFVSTAYDARVATFVECEDTHDDVSTLGDPFWSAGGTGAMFAPAIGPALENDEKTADNSISNDYDYARAVGDVTDAYTLSTAAKSGDENDNSAAGGSGKITTSTLGLGLGKMDSSLFDDDASFEKQYTSEERIEIDAPIGRLGVVIDTPQGGVPMVHAIKDSSVLADKVRVGDRLVSVDDVDTTELTAIEVSKLISSRSQNPSRILVFIRLGDSQQEDKEDERQ